MKWSIIIITIILLISGITLADRPDYSFSHDVFQELPPFPHDFWEIEGLLSSQSIMASQLNESYFQPEILPGWKYWAERIYSNDSNIFGSYGIFIYPSLFNIHNIQKGDTIDISALIYTNLGIQKYQGAEIYFAYPEHIDIELLEPANPNILLSPTYPQFLLGWMKVIKLRIHINEEKNASVTITERVPIDEYENKWKEIYQSDYISGNSLISQKIPKCRIELTVPEKEVVVKESNINTLPVIFFITFIIAILSIVVWIKYDRRRKNNKRT